MLLCYAFKVRSIISKNTTYHYWTYQFLGWGLASLYWAYGAYFIQDYTVFYTIANFILDVLIGVSLTHLYKRFINANGQGAFNIKNIIIPVISIVILAVLFMLLNNAKWYLYWHGIQEQNIDFLPALVHWDPPLMTGLRLMSIWVLLYHLYHYHKQQIALTAHNAELSVLSKQIQLDHLSNQLNPHFLFNSLNSVKSLISESPSKAKRSIDLLSDLLRSSVYAKDSMTSIEDEIQLINDYIELEKLRFEERLQLEVTIDDSVLRYKIPSLCIQTLIENALKHGIQNSIKGGIIRLSVSKTPTHIEIIVQNPGKLDMKNTSDSANFGLKNLRKRLYLQYKEKAIFSIEETLKETVKATMIIPII